MPVYVWHGWVFVWLFACFFNVLSMWRSKLKIASGWNVVPVSVRADLDLRCFSTTVRQLIQVLPPLAVPNFDSPCFLTLRDLTSNLLPPVKRSQLWFMVSFISAPWTLSCTLVCPCSSLSSLLLWLLVVRSPNRRWKSCRRKMSGSRKTRISSAKRKRRNSSPVTLKPRSLSTFYRWGSGGIGNNCLRTVPGGSYRSPPRSSALKLFCKTLYSMSHCSFPLTSPFLF